MSQLRMRRNDLDGLPTLKWPEGCRIRPAIADDEVALACCLKAAFPEMDWTPAKATDELLEHPQVSASFLVIKDDEVVATASCKDIADLPETGYVHWVAAKPEARGLKLGYWVSLATLLEFKKQGKKDAILDTDDPRLPAIKTYLNLGFEPDLIDDDHAERWAEVKNQL